MFKKIIEKLYLKNKKNLAYYDAFADCYNRNYFEIETKKKIEKEEVFIVIVDINDLKKVNDVKGHCSGDKLIKKISSKLKAFTNELIRFGGDEFFMYFKEKEKLDLFLNFAKSENTIAVGYALKNIDDDLSLILNLADENMYLNKQYKKSINKK